MIAACKIRKCSGAFASDMLRLSAVTLLSLLEISIVLWFCAFAKAQECQLLIDSDQLFRRGVKVCSHGVGAWTTLVTRLGGVRDQSGTGDILSSALQRQTAEYTGSDSGTRRLFTEVEDSIQVIRPFRLSAMLPEAAQLPSPTLLYFLFAVLFLMQVNLCLIYALMLSRRESVWHSELAPCFCCWSRRTNYGKSRQTDLFFTAPTSPTPRPRTEAEIMPKPEAVNAIEPIVVADRDIERLDSDHELLMQLIKIASRTKAITVKPQVPARIWGLGVGSLRGNVRSEQQDRAVGFEIGSYQVLVVADGLGGPKHGRKAALNAVKAAASRIMFTLGSVTNGLQNDVESVASEAVRAAAQRLSLIGKRKDIRGDGLRTTLIVIVGNRQEIGYAYIGDGGGCIFRYGGDVMHFLQPQKADINTPNVLAASLGPVIQGCPVTGKIPILEGDLVVIGTDGVFDRLEASPDQFPAGTNRFIRDLVVGAAKYGGDLQVVTERVLLELAEMKDELGFICSDNMSLGMLGIGIQPAIPNESVEQSDESTSTRGDIGVSSDQEEKS